MEREDEYLEIDLKAMLFRVLYQWKRILAVALVMALLLGGLQALRSVMAADEPQEKWTDQESYRRELSLRRDRVDAAQDKIDALQEYIDHAVLMKADYRNVYIAKATYYIDSGYQILPENTYQNPDKTGTLAWHYQNYLQDHSIYEALSGKIGVDAKYLMDLVTVDTANGNTLFLAVSHPYERSARQIMEAMQEYLDSIRQQLEQSVHPHSLTLMLDTCGAYVDENLKAQQQQTCDDMLLYEQELIKAQQELEAHLEAGEPSENTVLKTFLKWGLLGGISGGGLVALWYAFLAGFGGCLYSANALSGQYNLPMVGSLCLEKKLDPATRFLRKLEGRLTENSPANDLLLAENLKLYCKDGPVVLYSDAGCNSSAQAIQRLQPLLPGLKLVPKGSLTTDAGALASLKDCGCALVVITAGASRRTSVEKAVKLLHSRKIPTAGFLVLD